MQVVLCRSNIYYTCNCLPFPDGLRFSPLVGERNQPAGLSLTTVAATSTERETLAACLPYAEVTSSEELGKKHCRSKRHKLAGSTRFSKFFTHTYALSFTHACRLIYLLAKLNVILFSLRNNKCQICRQLLVNAICTNTKVKILNQTRRNAWSPNIRRNRSPV